MAGIGFALRRLLEQDTYAGVLRAYAYASVIGSGPWLLSIIGILAIGLLSLHTPLAGEAVAQFQVSVTYLIAATLILTGPIQLGFTRYIADLVYRGEEGNVLPNFHGALCAVTWGAGLLGLFLLPLFDGLSVAYRVLMLAGFVLVADVWVATILLSGLKEYAAVLALYALGYGITVGGALWLRPLGVEGLLGAFVLGQAVLLAGMAALVGRRYPGTSFLAFDFARRGAMFPALLAVGLAFNLGIWIDKILFWFSEGTGQAVIGPLRASVIYDLPIFLAYLSIVPGMAVFLVRLETDFAEAYQRFYGAVREGARLETLEQARDEMVASIRRGLFEIIKIQSIAALLVFVAGPSLLEWAGIPRLYLPLLYVDVIAAGLQVVLLGLLNVFFYLDKRGTVLGLTAAFLAMNAAFTWLSLQLGAPFYGYGFAAAMLLAVLAGFVALDRKLDSLEYETFMLQ
jgi:polysaccharide biosynthesis protein PelG